MGRRSRTHPLSLSPTRTARHAGHFLATRAVFMKKGNPAPTRHRGHSWFTSGMRERSVPARLAPSPVCVPMEHQEMKKGAPVFPVLPGHFFWCQRGYSNPHGSPHHLRPQGPEREYLTSALENSHSLRQRTRAMPGNSENRLLYQLLLGQLGARFVHRGLAAPTASCPCYAALRARPASSALMVSAVVTTALARKPKFVIADVYPSPSSGCTAAAVASLITATSKPCSSSSRR
jgi:hypothetical protein